MTNNIFSLSWRDLLKGLVIAVISPVVTVLLDTVNAGSFTMDWNHIIKTAVAAALTYIGHQFITNTNGSAAARLQDAATKTGEAIVITPKEITTDTITK